jgi:hypothetical protein
LETAPEIARLVAPEDAIAAILLVFSLWFAMHSWVGRNRRLDRDFEAITASPEAFLSAASVMILLRRIGRF